MRLRIGIEGKIFGFLPYKGTLAVNVPAKLATPEVRLVLAYIDGKPVEGGNIFKGKFFATLTPVV